jgi:hypothetical protein
MIQAIKESLSKIPKHNTIIGGIGVVQNTEALLASKLGISANQIFNFEVREDMSVACFIRDSYVLKSAAFNGDNNITYYNDIQGKCWKLSDNSIRSATIEWINFPNVTDVGTQTFYGAHKLEEIYLPNCERALGSYVCFRVMNNVKRIILPKLQIHQMTNENDFMYSVKNCEHLYIPLCTTIGKNTLRENQSFNLSSLQMNIYCHPSIETANNGSVEGDIAFAESSRQANIEYVTSFVKPLPVEDLTVGELFPHSVQLNFNDPNGANQGGFYEVWVNGVYNNEASYQGFATGLTPETTYLIKIKAVDKFYNKSIFSEEISITTPAALPFEFTIDTTKTSTGSTANNQFKLPLPSTGIYNCLVNWGDGTSNTITVYNQLEATHTYAVAGVYRISITGQIEQFQFNNGGDRLKMITLHSWGTLKVGASVNNFYGCANCDFSTIADTLDLHKSVSMAHFFRNCTALTTVNNINKWAFRQVKVASYMFYSCPNFNQALSFNTSQIRDFSYMLSYCTGFDSPLDFDTNQGTNFGYMFSNATKFNQPLNFEMSKATSLSHMFQNTYKFNHPINWNTKKVTTFMRFLSGAYEFNSPINVITSNATDLRYFFENARAYNQPVDFMDTTKATSFLNMFYNAYRFNQPINWNSPNVLDMTSMFWYAVDFNSPININTSKVTNWTNTFRNATSFDQPIGHLDIGKVTTFLNCFTSKGYYSPANLDDIYNQWSSRPVTASRTIAFPAIQYTSAGAAGRAILTGSPNNWVITDGGQI